MIEINETHIMFVQQQRSDSPLEAQWLLQIPVAVVLKNSTLYPQSIVLMGFMLFSE
jgi:hypothetical protein